MTVSSIEFLVLLLLLSGVFFHLPSNRMKQFVIALCNAGFLYSLIPNPSSWLLLAAFLLSGYAAAAYLRGHPRRSVFTLYLVILLATFIFLQRYDALAYVLPPSMLRHSFRIVGLSYILFRQIHFVVDSMQGQIKDPSLWTYLNYQMNLFTLLAGPIQSYQNFSSTWKRREPVLTDFHALLKSYMRIFLGVIKIAGVATACLFAYNELSAQLFHAYLGWYPLGWLTVILKFGGIFYLYPAYVYFNFSGYCDIVIATGALFGEKIPENFDQPYLSRNMIDYWTRWHRTLGFWIRDYTFTPMYKGIATNWPERADSLAFLCYFVALFLAGVWHGSTLNFVIFGLLHGAGVSAAKLWENHLVRTRGRTGLRAYLRSERIRLAATVATFHFACATFLVFTPNLGITLGILKVFCSAIMSAL